MKALWKSILFLVVAEQTKSNIPHRVGVCNWLSWGQDVLTSSLRSCRSRGASSNFSIRVTPNSINFRKWSLTRVALFRYRSFPSPWNNEGESTRPDPDNIWDTSNKWFLEDKTCPPHRHTRKCSHAHTHMRKHARALAHTHTHTLCLNCSYSSCQTVTNTAVQHVALCVCVWERHCCYCKCRNRRRSNQLIMIVGNM
jgi:hypothetical protein